VRRATLGLLALYLVALGLLACDRPPPAAKVTARGRVVSGAAVNTETKVLLVDPRVGLLEPIAVGPDGAFSAALPDDVVEPWIVIDSGGGALTQTGGLKGPPDVALRPLGVWRTDLRVRREGTRQRIDWGSVPSGEGFPSPVQYSLLVTYTRKDGSQHEATFPSKEASLLVEDAELLEYLPDHDPARPEVELCVRAFQPADASAVWWYGGKVRWTLGTEQLRPAD
jgi:hypothetical protein